MFSDDGVKPPARASPPEPISPALPPWHLAGDVYSFTWWNSATEGRSLPEHAYSPLEARATFATSPSSRPAGGLGMIQIIRYHTSPVGPYDEMVLIPGSFDWVRDGQDADGRPYRGRNPRITRIYVSQKHTCYNGRLSTATPRLFHKPARLASEVRVPFLVRAYECVETNTPSCRLEYSQASRTLRLGYWRRRFRFGQSVPARHEWRRD